MVPLFLNMVITAHMYTCTHTQLRLTTTHCQMPHRSISACAWPILLAPGPTHGPTHCSLVWSSQHTYTHTHIHNTYV